MNPNRNAALALTLAVAVLATTPSPWAAPYVAYVGNVPVHSASTGAKVLVLDLATGAAANVSAGLSSARRPVWSPGATLLAFEAATGDRRGVYVCRSDGRERRAVGGPAVWGGSPCFLDEHGLVFLAGPDRTVLRACDLDTGGIRQLTGTALFNKVPVASPDGATVALVGSAKLAGPGDIFLVTTADGSIHNLTQSPAFYSPPAFAPDGKALIFAFDGRDIGGAERGVASLPLTGGEPVRLATDGYTLGALCFSPDGDSIAYTSASEYHSTWVNIMNADGSGNRRITSGPAHIIGWPSFTADGGGLVYHGVQAARYTIRLLDLATGENRTVSPAGESGVTPACSPPLRPFEE